MTVTSGPSRRPEAPAPPVVLLPTRERPGRWGWRRSRRLVLRPGTVEVRDGDRVVATYAVGGLTATPPPPRPRVGSWDTSPEPVPGADVALLGDDGRPVALLDLAQWVPGAYGSWDHDREAWTRLAHRALEPLQAPWREDPVDPVELAGLPRLTPYSRRRLRVVWGLVLVVALLLAVGLLLTAVGVGARVPWVPWATGLAALGLAGYRAVPESRRARRPTGTWRVDGSAGRAGRAGVSATLLDGDPAALWLVEPDGSAGHVALRGPAAPYAVDRVRRDPRSGTLALVSDSAVLAVLRAEDWSRPALEEVARRLALPVKDREVTAGRPARLRAGEGLLDNWGPDPVSGVLFLVVAVTAWTDTPGASVLLAVAGALSVVPPLAGLLRR